MNSLLRLGGLLVVFAARDSVAATLVDDGKPVAAIVVASDGSEFDKLAALELNAHLIKMSGRELPLEIVPVGELDATVARLKKERQTRVLLGRAAAGSKLTDALAAFSTRRGAFVCRVTDDEIRLAGHDEGTLYGVFELLEQQGVRWFMPGDLGTVIPEQATVVVKRQETKQQPSFASRWFQMPDRDWQMRVRCGGRVFVGAHGIKLPPFKTHPELYSLLNGQRSSRQHCVSNPATIDFAVQSVREARRKGQGPMIGMGPNDGRGFCECEKCRALDGGDFDPFSHEPSVTDRYIWFFNQVLEKLGPDDDTQLAFYIYHSYMRPPVRWKPHPRITGALAPIGLDRVHGFSNPVAPEKSYARWLYQEWGKLLPELYDRGYWSNLADPGFPFLIMHRLRDEIPACHALGVKGWRVETFPNYGSTLPSNYIAAKLMWDHTADVDALLVDFTDKFFGPAAKPMSRYVARMDAALRDSEHCTGSAWDMPWFYPPAVRRAAREDLVEAHKLAGGESPYAERVRMVTETFDLLEGFIAMLDARARIDFPRAKQELERMDEIANRLMAYQPTPMLAAGRFSTYVNYMRRFYRPCTEQGFARVTGGNRLVAAAQDEWDFQIDPQRVGESIGLWRADLKGGLWQRLKTSTSSWSNQGLRYYKGLAWYRQKLDVPADAKGQRVFLWCGGVDEKAKVWLNGQPIGISHGASFSPFEMDATPALRAGETNVVTICVMNDVVNELGTGGIVAPVILYRPAAGADAKLENARPLGETFP